MFGGQVGSRRVMVGEHSKDSFVARIWLEDGDNGDKTWRGHIRHVQGEEEVYFRDLMEMREFLGRVSGSDWASIDCSTAQGRHETRA